MRTALDSNILSSLWSNEPTAGAISHALAQATAEGALVMSPIAYAELFAYPKSTEGFLQHFLGELSISVDFRLDGAVWTEAGRRFAVYANRRRRSGGGSPRRLVADFVVGAHALLHAERLMTLDAARYERDFPELSMYDVGV